MQKRNFKDYFIISLKGMAMGAADVVPGVSGGTIAFISGIYEELLGSISAVNTSLFRKFKEEGFAAVWKEVNGNFLLALFAGIFMSIFTLAKVISGLLETQPILVWSFFFGLVLASILYVGKQIDSWNGKTVAILILGAFIAYYITTLKPVFSDEVSLAYIFMSGALAICAMILPGISGAFILVILGAYKSVLDAIEERDIKVLLTFAVGAVVGILSFSKVLKWLFSNYRNLTLAALTGFILGSLNKIWPWKHAVTFRTNSHGEQVPFNEVSVLPWNYEGDAQLLFAIVLAVTGFGLILILESLATNKTD